MLSIVATNLLRRPARSLFTAAGVAVGVATIVALLSFTQGLSRTAAGLVHLGGSSLGVFQSGTSEPTTSILPQSLVARLAALPQVQRATPLLLMVEVLKSEPGAVVFGAAPSGFFAHGLVILEGHALGEAPQVLVGDRLASTLGVRVGDTLTVKGRRLGIGGIYQSGVLFEDAGVVMPIEVARQLDERPGEETDVVVDLATGARAGKAAKTIERAVPGTEVISDSEQVARVGANGRLISKAILVIVVIALIVGAIGVTNTMAMSIAERQSELGLLSTVGWSPLRVAALILGEGIVVSLVGAAAGLLVGVIGAELLIHALGVSSFISPVVTAWGLGRGLLVGVAIGVLGGIYPAIRVTRMQPLKALAGT